MLEPFCIYSVYNTTKKQYDKEKVESSTHKNKYKSKKVLTKK